MRYAASVQYNGADYHGWQRLRSGLPSVQQEVEAALSKVANHLVTVVCAGRTDARVHGCNQVIHFDSDADRSERDWTYGVNANMSDSVAVNWVQSVNDAFHARFSAQWRRYRYIIFNDSIRSAHLTQSLTWCYTPLDADRMQQAACYLVGKHNFNSYRAAHCQASNAVRSVSHLRVSRYGRLLVIDIQANAFLQHMVRNIAGVLMAIGCGKREPLWAKEVLDAEDRKMGGVTASPRGLYLVDVGYPDSFALPTSELGPQFVAGFLS